MSNYATIRNAHTGEMFAGDRFAAAGIITGWFPNIATEDPDGADALERFLDAVERGSWDQDSATYLGLAEGHPLSRWVGQTVTSHTDPQDSWVITAMRVDDADGVWLATDTEYGTLWLAADIDVDTGDDFTVYEYGYPHGDQDRAVGMFVGAFA